MCVCACVRVCVCVCVCVRGGMYRLSDRVMCACVPIYRDRPLPAKAGQFGKTRSPLLAGPRWTRLDQQRSLCSIGLGAESSYAIEIWDDDPVRVPASLIILPSSRQISAWGKRVCVDPFFILRSSAYSMVARFRCFCRHDFLGH